ncbi:unnamed protein product [Closterium sp. NIES-65]|nr:unnamed protein product [Closterium sp. NIES-65]
MGWWCHRTSPDQQVLEGNTPNVDVTAPGAILALAMMYLQSNNEAVAARLAPPATHFALEFVRPDFILLRVLACSLILWDSVQPSEEWVAAQVPRIIRTAAAATGGGEEERGAGENEGEGGVGKGAREGGGEGEADVDEEAMALALCNVLAGCCLSIGESHHATCCLSIGESHHATCCLSIGESHHATCCLSIGESHHATCCLSIGLRYAGSANGEAEKLLRSYALLFFFLRERLGYGLWREEGDGRGGGAKKGIFHMCASKNHAHVWCIHSLLFSSLPFLSPSPHPPHPTPLTRPIPLPRPIFLSPSRPHCSAVPSRPWPARSPCRCCTGGRCWTRAPLTPLSTLPCSPSPLYALLLPLLHSALPPTLCSPFYVLLCSPQPTPLSRYTIVPLSFLPVPYPRSDTSSLLSCPNTAVSAAVLSLSLVRSTASPSLCPPSFILLSLALLHFAVLPNPPFLFQHSLAPAIYPCFLLPFFSSFSVRNHFPHLPLNSSPFLPISSCQVMAGTGHLPSLRLLRFFHRRTAAAADAAAVNAATTYGSHMAVSMAIGFLGLSACQATFSTSPPAVAALLLALFPHFPSSPADHRCHLQALRHFWVLAVEERAFVEAVDVDTWQPVIAPLHLTLKPSDSSTPTALSLHTPCLLPPLPQVLSHSPQVLSHSPQVLSHSPQMIFPLGSGAALAAGVEERQLWEASTHGMYTCPPTNSLCHAAMPLLLPAVTPSFPLLLPAVTPSFPLLLPAVTPSFPLPAAPTYRLTFCLPLFPPHPSLPVPPLPSAEGAAAVWRQLLAAASGSEDSRQYGGMHVHAWGMYVACMWVACVVAWEMPCGMVRVVAWEMPCGMVRVVAWEMPCGMVRVVAWEMPCGMVRVVAWEMPCGMVRVVAWEMPCGMVRVVAWEMPCRMVRVVAWEMPCGMVRVVAWEMPCGMVRVVAWEMPCGMVRVVAWEMPCGMVRVVAWEMPCGMVRVVAWEMPCRMVRVVAWEMPCGMVRVVAWEMPCGMVRVVAWEMPCGMVRVVAWEMPCGMVRVVAWEMPCGMVRVVAWEMPCGMVRVVAWEMPCGMVRVVAWEMPCGMVQVVAWEMPCGMVRVVAWEMPCGMVRVVAWEMPCGMVRVVAWEMPCGMCFSFAFAPSSLFPILLALLSSSLLPNSSHPSLRAMRGRRRGGHGAVAAGGGGGRKAVGSAMGAGVGGEGSGGRHLVLLVKGRGAQAGSGGGAAAVGRTGDPRSRMGEVSDHVRLHAPCPAHCPFPAFPFITALETCNLHSHNTALASCIQLVLSCIQLVLSCIQLELSCIQLELSCIQLELSCIQLELSCIQLELSCIQLVLSCTQLVLSCIQLELACIQLELSCIQLELSCIQLELSCIQLVLSCIQLVLSCIQLELSCTQLVLSCIQLELACIQLELSCIQLELSCIQLELSCIQLELSCIQLELSCIQLVLSCTQLVLSCIQLELACIQLELSCIQLELSCIQLELSCIQLVLSCIQLVLSCIQLELSCIQLVLSCIQLELSCIQLVLSCIQLVLSCIQLELSCMHWQLLSSPSHCLPLSLILQFPLNPSFPPLPHHPFPHSPIIPSPTPSSSLPLLPPSSLPPLPHHPFPHSPIIPSPTPPSSHSPIIPLPHHPTPPSPFPLLSPPFAVPCIPGHLSLHPLCPAYSPFPHLFYMPLLPCMTTHPYTLCTPTSFPPLSLSPNLTPVISHTSLHTFPLASLGQLPPVSARSMAAALPVADPVLSAFHRLFCRPLPRSAVQPHATSSHEGFSSACQAALLMAHAAEQPELLEVLLSLATTCQAVRSLHHSHTTCGSALPCLVSSFQVTSSCLSPATSFPSTQPCKAEGQGASCGIAGTSSTVTVAYGNTMEFHRRHLEP